MKYRRLLSIIMCICLIIGFVPFISVKTEAASAPTDINGNVWKYSTFVSWCDKRTKLYDGKRRILISHGKFKSYGSELKDSKYPIVDNNWFEIRTTASEYSGSAVRNLNVPYEKVDKMWTMEYYDTTSNADRYKICLSDGKTYLKDNTGSLSTSGGDMTVTTSKSAATAWDLRFIDFADWDGSARYSFGHDINYADPHFCLNESNGRTHLDLSRKTTFYFNVYFELPWITTRFYDEDGGLYKQDMRQTDFFSAPEGPKKAGYTFIGWTTTRGGTNIAYKKLDKIYPSSDMSYYPVYAPNSYTVRFYQDSTMTGSYEDQGFKYDKSQNLRKNTFTSPVADFAGWQSASDASKTYVDGESVKNLTKDANGIVKLYALWNEISYTVTYSANYGTGSAPMQTVKYSENFALPDEKSFKREGYKLIGWNTEPDGSGSGFVIGQPAQKLSTKANDIITLYAIWEAVHNHTAGDWETARPATCTENGERVKKCTSCGTVVERGTIDALGHKEGSCCVINKESTCNGMGEKVWYCDRCGIPVKTEPVSVKGHTEGKPSTKLLPTCKADGIRVICCEDCGALLKEEKIPALNHTSGDFITEKCASCFEDGIKVKKCERCGIVTEESVIPKTEHTPGLWQITKDCTCSESGLKQQSCSVCGALIGEPVIIEAHEHTLGESVTNIKATCTAGGENVITCTVCKAIIKTEKTEKLGHAAGIFTTVKTATCCESGLKAQKCESCGVVLAEEEIPAKGHTKGEYYITTQKATCNDAGEKVFYCKDCGIPIATEAVSAKGHRPGIFATVLEPTCTSEGRKEQKCEDCGATLAEDKISPKGHLGEVWTTTISPTCTGAGEKVCKCGICSAVYKTERIEPLGHTPGSPETCSDDQICMSCGVILKRADKRNHTWSEWTTYKESKYFSERQEKRICTSCNETEYRYVKGSAECHKHFPHSGDGSNCTACKVLYNVNTFFRKVNSFLFGWMIKQIMF